MVTAASPFMVPNLRCSGGAYNTLRASSTGRLRQNLSLRSDVNPTIDRNGRLPYNRAALGAARRRSVRHKCPRRLVDIFYGASGVIGGAERTQSRRIHDEFR